MERVTVNVRSPVSCISDVRLDCRLDWKVFRIKQKISELFPGNPSTQSQKLVYAGKLLEDSAMLRDFLRLDDDCSIYTIHLVCRVPETKSDAAMVEKTTTTTTTEECGSGTVGVTGVGDGGPEQEQVHDWMLYMQNLSQNSSQLSEENLQQMAWMQQMYSQYLNQYMMYMHSAAGVPFVQPALGVDSVQPDVHVQRAQGEVPGGGGGGGGGGLAPVLNAGGGGGGVDFQQQDVEGAGRNGDFLDWFYVSSRLLVLVSIVYFYSSLARFLLVGALFLFLYGIQMGLLQGQHREQRNNIQQEVNNIRGQEEEQQQQHQLEPAEDEEEEDGGEPDVLTVVSTFVLTFFSSLIPDINNQAVV